MASHGEKVVLLDIDWVLCNDEMIMKPKEFSSWMDEKDSEVINMGMIGLMKKLDLAADLKLKGEE